MASQDGPTRWLACRECSEEPYRPPCQVGWTVTTPSVTAAPAGSGEQRQGTHAACAATLSAEAGRIPPATTWTPSPNAVYTRPSRACDHLSPQGWLRSRT